MNRQVVDQIVSAVLYEGYILYPYRPSLKNRQRWTFGGLYPRAYSEAQAGAEAWSLQTQCLVQGDDQCGLDVSVRFLHLMDRRIAQLDEADGRESFVDSLQVGQTLYQAWQEAVQREVLLAGLVVGDLVGLPRRQAFQFPGRQQREAIRSADGRVAGVIVRQQEPIEGSVEIVAEPVGEGLFRISVRVGNESGVEGLERASRDEALMRALVSTHVVLGAQRGEFVSLTDPPAPFRQAAAECRNVGAWPVLVGREGEKDTLLCSPIILYDYPQIAPESPGQFFDSTEIDELLTLRILTLTDDEKRAMDGIDDRASALLARTEEFAREELLGLHGAVRGLRPVEKEEG